MKRTAQKPGHFFATILAGWLSVGLAAGAATDQPNTTTRKSSDWLRKAVVYEIFPRNFSKEGTFNAITSRLDELKDLGVDIIWLMPIHPIGQKVKKGSIGSPYAVRDYYAINSDYGTSDDLKQLLAGAHQRGIKVILDIVAGHTAWDSVLIDQHPEFYKKDASGKIIPPVPDWTDVAALDYDKQEVRRYMIDMLKFWLKDFGVDGFRCDVAFSPLEFWETARIELDQVNPEVILLADANANPKLLSKAFNMDNSGALSSALSLVMRGVASADLLNRSWENTSRQFPEGSLHLRFSDNHETVRAVVRFGLEGALAAQVLMLSLDGVPLLYNGMEVGDSTESADPALFEKLPIFWNAGGRPPLREIYRSLIKLRKQHPAFYNQKVAWLQNTAPAEVVSLLRSDDKDEFVVLINLSSRNVSGSIEAADVKNFTVLNIDGIPAVPKSNLLPEFQLGGYEWRIYHRQAGK